jgi:hypothetical protein
MLRNNLFVTFLGSISQEKTNPLFCREWFGWLLLVLDGKWPVRLLERDVATGMWRGHTTDARYVY